MGFWRFGGGILAVWGWVLEVWGWVLEEIALASSPCFQTLNFKPAPAQVRMFSPDAAGQEENWQDCSG